jgi:hypothetical protein
VPGSGKDGRGGICLVSPCGNICPLGGLLQLRGHYDRRIGNLTHVYEMIDDFNNLNHGI